MTQIEKDIKVMQEYHDTLELHLQRGGDFAADMLSAVKSALKCMKKAVPRALTDCDDDFTYGQCAECGNTCDEFADCCDECGQRLDWATTKCISRKCISCGLHENGGKVCERYADKVDEIRRIHDNA